MRTMLVALILATATPAIAHPWLLGIATGAEVVGDPAAAWVGLDEASATSISATRELSRNLAATLALNLWGESGDRLSLRLSEARAGLLLGWGEPGIFGFIRPYARADLLAGWAHVSAAGLADDAFVPGAEVALGTRMHYRRIFGYIETGYAWRDPQRFHLTPEEDGGLATTPTPLGEIDLSSVAARIGVGMTF